MTTVCVRGTDWPDRRPTARTKDPAVEPTPGSRHSLAAQGSRGLQACPGRRRSGTKRSSVFGGFRYSWPDVGPPDPPATLTDYRTTGEEPYKVSETLEERADRLARAHVIPRDRPRPPRPCVTLGCGRTDTRLFMNGPLCPDHAPALPEHRPSPVPSPGLPPRVYGTATDDPAPRIR